MIKRKRNKIIIDTNRKEVAYLGFEISDANETISPVFLIDYFLYTVSYKLILSVIDLINTPTNTKEYSFSLEPALEIY